MLSFNNTESFFQVKSILTRLRREFQKIDFLTVIEIQHAILVSPTNCYQDIVNLLQNDGYSLQEIERAIKLNLENDLIFIKNCNELFIPQQHIQIARRLLILDIASNYSTKVTSSEKSSQKYILVPGYGANMGIKESLLSDLCCDICKKMSIKPTEFIEDIEWLLDEGAIKRF